MRSRRKPGVFRRISMISSGMALGNPGKEIVHRRLGQVTSPLLSKNALRWGGPRWGGRPRPPTDSWAARDGRPTSLRLSCSRPGSARGPVPEPAFGVQAQLQDEGEAPAGDGKAQVQPLQQLRRPLGLRPGRAGESGRTPGIGPGWFWASGEWPVAAPGARSRPGLQSPGGLVGAGGTRQPGMTGRRVAGAFPSAGIPARRR